MKSDINTLLYAQQADRRELRQEITDLNNRLTKIATGAREEIDRLDRAHEIMRGLLSSASEMILDLKERVAALEAGGANR